MLATECSKLVIINKEKTIMGLISTLGKSLDNAQRLKELHQHIERYNVPVTSKDDLFQQFIEIERYLGGTDYASIHAKKSKVNILTGIFAMPILIFALFFIPDRYLKYFNIEFDIAGMARNLSITLFEQLWAVIAYACAFVGSILYFYYLNRRAETEANRLIQSFITRTSGHP
ncbi:DUF6097 family protein [Pectobacterium polonicum]|uniref:DUF6097 family protein n=1 Tax=Pectobacterium polonicum TaxID=2485124 RepID=UPI00235FD2DD|nr:DUF6097 family protein [Pectobacterium polonicum]MDC9819207.1 DUF6097 family protein [Pectobacterium polonicum]